MIETHADSAQWEYNNEFSYRLDSYECIVPSDIANDLSTVAFLLSPVVIWSDLLGGIQSGEDPLPWYWELWDSGPHHQRREAAETHSLPR